MQQDPKFKQLAQRSHILRNAKDLEVPMVPIRISVLDQAVATLLITAAIQLPAYMLDTVKVRVQARHVDEDVAHFTRNKVSKQPVMKGLMKGYGLVLIGDAIHLTVSKLYGIVAGCAVETVLKTWLEISKVCSQMGKRNEIDLMKLAWRNCLPLGFCRDIIYRSIFAYGVKRNIEQQRVRRRYNQSDYIRDLLLYSAIGVFVSHPFDVLFTKFASQRYPKYSNPIQALKAVVQEEKRSKLFGSGVFFRLIAVTGSAYAMAKLYNPLLTMAHEAF